MHEAYLAFGGNIGPVRDRIFTAWEMLRRSPIITLAAHSQLYHTAPMGGPVGQADYVNAACRVRTTASARELLDICLTIERDLGRERHERWGPRTIDIDLILYDDEQRDEPGLRVPHPYLRERLFVLVPLSDVASPELALPPDGRRLGSVLAALLAASGETLEDWRRRVTD